LGEEGISELEEYVAGF